MSILEKIGQRIVGKAEFELAKQKYVYPGFYGGSTDDTFLAFPNGRWSLTLTIPISRDADFLMQKLYYYSTG